MGLFKKKDPIVEVEKALDHEVHEMEHDIQADVDAVMKKYDRESNTRIWEGAPKIALRVLMSAFSIYCILMTLFSKALPERRLSLFLGFIIIIGYLVYPARKGAARVNHVPWYDWILMVLGAGSFFYFAINAFSIIQLATKLQPIHIIVGAIGIVVLIELCRRCVGLPILVVLGLLLIYTFYNQLSWDPSFYKALKNIVYKLFYTTSGVIGTPVSVCYTYIVLFIIFGAFLERTGIANFFISFANRLAGWSSGGPAKVAVISSALCGMVSGSSVGNTVTTGSVTIPMMKKTGYKPEFAGAVEAAASTGGQIMPPIMGAAAFLMAEYMNIPYAKVAVKAILPAVLYFTGIFIAVHLEAKKLGLKGMPKSEMVSWGELAKRAYLIIPLALLIFLVSSGSRTMQFSAAVSILAAIVVGFLNKDERLTFGKIVEALEAGAKGAITVAVLCHGWYDRRLHHRHRSCFHPHQRHRADGRRRHYDRPAADDDLLHHPGHGRSYHRKLLHHGLHLRPHSGADGLPPGGGSLLRVLLRHRGGHYASGGSGCLCRRRHCQGQPYENRHQRHQAGHRSLYRAIHFCLQPRYAV